MEEYKQQIHELKRSLDIERANQEFIAAELESIHVTHEQQKADMLKKHAQDVQMLRNRAEELERLRDQSTATMEAEIRSLKLQIQSLKDTASQQQAPPKEDFSETFAQLEQIHELSENLQCVQEEVYRLTSENGSLRDRLDNAQEKIQCLEETLQSKRTEVEEREQALEQFQDTIHELRTELMQMQSDPDPECNKKGNSLFAEVIDQRQQVLHILGAQNRSFKEMKRAYRQSEAEIRQLKEENALMVREIDKIKTLFSNADRSHAAHLTQRIVELKGDLDRYKQHTQFIEGQLTDGKVIACMDFFRKQTEVMRQELNQSRMQKCEMNDLLHAAQEELAQWRFQCLKQKCVLIDREMRLEANNIAFESRCAVPVDETVHVSVDEWQGGSDADLLVEVGDEEQLLQQQQQQQRRGGGREKAIIPETLEMLSSAYDDPDAAVEVSVIKLPGEEEEEGERDGVKLEGGAEAINRLAAMTTEVRERAGRGEVAKKLEIKAEPKSPVEEVEEEMAPSTAVVVMPSEMGIGTSPAVKYEEEERRVKDERVLGAMLSPDERSSDARTTTREDGDFCEIVAPELDSVVVIDLCTTTTETTRTATDDTAKATGDEERSALVVDVKRELLMDMSMLEDEEEVVLVGMDVSVVAATEGDEDEEEESKKKATTRKAMDFELSFSGRQRPVERRSEQMWTPSPGKENIKGGGGGAGGPINLDFLLDSPNKPQRHKPGPVIMVVDCASPVVGIQKTLSPTAKLPSSTGKEKDSNKENENRKKGSGGGGVTKLSYKPINNSRKSILVKRTAGLTDNNHKNVHFASDVKVVKEVATEGGKAAAASAVASGGGGKLENKKAVEGGKAEERPKKKLNLTVRNIHSRPPKAAPATVSTEKK